jgi:hypothetical protein
MAAHGIIDPMELERAAERAYGAFCESLKELLPPGTQAWREMHPRVRAAWIAAAEAARS